jgi:hypothetical protein
MAWLVDLLFPGLDWEEIARLSELGVMTVMLMVSVFVVGAVSTPTPARVRAKKF